MRLLTTIAIVAPISMSVGGCGQSEQPPKVEASTAVDDASDPDTAKAMADVNLKALLKDPDSAKFRKVVISKISGGNLMLCGEVNSKNAFGGFTGYKGFIASPNSEAPTIIDGETDGITRAMFKQAYAMACANVVAKYS